MKTTLNDGSSLLFSIFRLRFINNIFCYCLTEGDVYRSRSILGLANDVNETLAETLDLNTTTESTTTDSFTYIPSNGLKNCTRAAIFELPSDGFTREQRQKGWIAIHILFACYCFWFLASICDDYFVPAIQSICSCKWMPTFWMIELNFRKLKQFSLPRLQLERRCRGGHFHGCSCIKPWIVHQLRRNVHYEKWPGRWCNCWIGRFQCTCRSCLLWTLCWQGI